MTINITTPSLLFPALSLLLLAYTNRFLATAQLIRALSRQKQEDKEGQIKNQIINLKQRLELVKWMQFFGVASVLLCTISMFFIFIEFGILGEKIFGISLASMFISLVLSLWEVIISTKALDLELHRMEKIDEESIDLLTSP